MSIHATLNLTNSTCNVNNNISAGETSTEIQVSLEGLENIKINHLRFGYDFSINDSIISSITFPPVGKIDTVSNSTVIYETVAIESNSNYSMVLWAENGGIKFDKEFTITTPLPLQPHPSWTWNGTEWVAPVPVPTNGPADASYKWSEKQQKWFLLVPPLSQFDDI